MSPHPISYAAELLHDLPASRCRWPLGNPRDPAFRWCAELVTPGRSYCPEHEREAVDPELKIPHIMHLGGLRGRRR